MYHIFFIHSSFGHLGCFYVLAIVNSAAVNIRSKETINKTKRQSSELEKIFASEATDKELTQKIYKQSMELNNKRKQRKMGRRP